MKAQKTITATLTVLAMLAVERTRSAPPEPPDVADQRLEEYPIRVTLIVAIDAMRSAEDARMRRSEATVAEATLSGSSNLTEAEERGHWIRAARLFRTAHRRALTDPTATVSQKTQAAFGIAACTLEVGRRDQTLDFDFFDTYIPITGEGQRCRVDLAARLLKRGRFEDCLRVLPSEPTSADALWLQANARSSLCEVQQRDYASAHLLFKRFATQYPDNENFSEAEYGAARMAMLDRDFATAEDWFRSSLAKDKNGTDKTVNGVSRLEQQLGLANALFGLEKIDQAMALFQTLSQVESDQSEFAMFRLAQCLAKKKQYREALSLLDELKDEQLRREAEGWRYRWTLLSGGQLDDAAQGALRLIEMYRKASDHVKASRYQKAVVLFLQVASNDHDDGKSDPENQKVYDRLAESSLCQAALCQYELGEWRACCRLVAQLLERYPETACAPQAGMFQTLSLTKLQKFDDAQAALDQALCVDLNPSRRRHHLMQAARLFESEGALLHSAVAYEKVACELDVESQLPTAKTLPVIRTAIRLRTELGQFSQATRLVLRALELPSLDAAEKYELNMRLVEHHRALGESDRAISLLREIMEDKNFAPPALLKIAVILQRGQHEINDEAAEVYFELVTRYPDSPEAIHQGRRRLNSFLQMLKRRL